MCYNNNKKLLVKLVVKDFKFEYCYGCALRKRMEVVLIISGRHLTIPKWSLHSQLWFSRHLHTMMCCQKKRLDDVDHSPRVGIGPFGGGAEAGKNELN